MTTKVLIVEDEPDIQEVERTVVEDLLGYEVVLASTGEEALDLAPEVTPDLVVLDLVLPGIDGFAVASRMRSDPRLNRVCILALSGLTRREDKDRALAAGCNEVLDKPFDLEDLLRKVQGLAQSCATPGPPPP